MTLYMYITNQHDNNERNQDIFTLIMKHKKKMKTISFTF